MEPESGLENEQDYAKRVESKESQEDLGAEMLENPPGGDFIAGLKAFVVWVESLLAKKD
jgi:hypothetical protein